MKKILKLFASIFGIIKLIFQVVISCFNNRKKCILVSNGFSLSGAPIVLFEVAKIYKDNGYEIFFYSQHFGKLTNKCKENGFHYVVIPFFEKTVQKIFTKIKAEFYFVNTVVNYSWIDFLVENNQKVYWWLHEGDTYIVPCVENLKKIKHYEDVKIYAVSSWTIKELQKNNIYYDIKLLPYGCEDFYKNDDNQKLKNKESNTINLLMIGNICKRKNQIYFVEQLNKLNSYDRNRIEVFIIGSKLNGEDEYYKKFQNVIKGKPYIKYIETVPHNKINEYYEKSDIVVCTSLDDPLPVFLTEGLMFGKIILTSDNTGHYDLIKDGYNGFTYSNTIEDNLKETLTNIMNLDKDKIMKVSVEARKTYEKNFELKKFTDTLLRETINKN